MWLAWANGCICCSLSDGLLATVMLMVRKEEKPEHIIVETSGVADLFEVARTFSDVDLQACAPLEGIVTVVDAELAPHSRIK
jgi:G3E family GTPase